jgi:hypothetical protein
VLLDSIRQHERPEVIYRTSGDQDMDALQDMDARHDEAEWGDEERSHKKTKTDKVRGGFFFF